MKFQLPIHFVENVENTWGEAGRKWLNNLPALIENFAGEWRLHSLQMAENLSFNMVLFAERDLKREHVKEQERIGYIKNQNNNTAHEKVVLKLCPYTNKKEFAHEISVLKFYNGVGTARILNYDLEKSAMLLERIRPGTPLKKLFPHQDKEAVFIAAEVMKKLHSVKLESKNLDPLKLNNEIYHFPTIKDWLQTLALDFNAIPQHLLLKARKLSSNLVNTQQSQVLLHGDLHHENIIKFGENEDWISIDPKGVMGEPAYEIGAFIRNPIPEIFALNRDDFKKLTLERIEQFSQLLNVDKQRLLDWSFVQTILSACWAIEDNSSIWKPMLEVAEFLDSLT